MLDTAKVRELRQARRLTQGQAARLAGFGAGKSRWNEIEMGRAAMQRGVSITTLSKVARTLGVKPRDLLKQ